MVPFQRSAKAGGGGVRRFCGRVAARCQLLVPDRGQCLTLVAVVLVLLATWGLLRSTQQPLEELLVADPETAALLAATATLKEGEMDEIPLKTGLRKDYAINFGGPAFVVPTTGRRFEDGRVPALGRVAVDAADVAAAQPSGDHAPLYATGTLAGPALDWLLPAMKPGVYALTLYFAELKHATRGMRSYDVFLQEEEGGAGGGPPGGGGAARQVAAAFDPLAAQGGGFRRGVVLSVAGLRLQQGRLRVTVSHAAGLDPTVCLNALALTPDDAASVSGPSRLGLAKKELVLGTPSFVEPLGGGLHSSVVHNNYSCELSDTEPGPPVGTPHFSIKGNPSVDTGLQGPGRAAVPLPYLWLSHPSPSGLRVIDPSGAPVKLQEHGRLLGSGDHVYSFRVEVAGQHNVTYRGATLASYATHPEDSVCPEAFDKFEARFQCSVEDAVAAENAFKRWEADKVLTEEFFEGVWNDFNDRSRADMRFILHFTILSNKLYWRSPNDVAAHAVFIELLLSLLRKARVPDVEFFYNSADFGRVTIFDMLPPIFSFSSLPHQGDVLVPHPIALSEIYGNTYHLQAATSGRAWGRREAKAFFWGTNSGYRPTTSVTALRYDRRWRAHFLAKRRPDLLTAVVIPEHRRQFSNETLEYLRLGGHLAPPGGRTALGGAGALPQRTEGRYRYALVVDGNSAPGDTATRLAAGALVLKQRSPFQEHFFRLLRPCRHYLPVDHHLNNLGEAVEWARKHDRVARQIQLNGFHLVMTRLRPQDMVCYVAYLLRALAAVQHFDPKVREGMIIIHQQPQDDSHKCQFGAPVD